MSGAAAWASGAPGRADRGRGARCADRRGRREPALPDRLHRAPTGSRSCARTAPGAFSPTSATRRRRRPRSTTRSTARSSTGDLLEARGRLAAHGSDRLRRRKHHRAQARAAWASWPIRGSSWSPPRVWSSGCARSRTRARSSRSRRLRRWSTRLFGWLFAPGLAGAPSASWRSRSSTRCACAARAAPSFPSIVASGAARRAAARPAARCGDRARRRS